MNHIDKVLYTAHAHATGGRNGAAKGDDGRLDMTLISLETQGGDANPEQLFAAGWSVCFIGAMGRGLQSGKSLFPQTSWSMSKWILVQTKVAACFRRA